MQQQTPRAGESTHPFGFGLANASAPLRKGLKYILRKTKTPKGDPVVPFSKAFQGVILLQ